MNPSIRACLHVGPIVVNEVETNPITLPLGATAKPLPTLKGRDLFFRFFQPFSLAKLKPTVGHPEKVSELICLYFCKVSEYGSSTISN